MIEAMLLSSIQSNKNDPITYKAKSRGQTNSVPAKSNKNSPSQKIQSHAQRKQVVASGLEHKLHDRAAAAG